MPRRRRPPRPGALADLSPLRIATQIALLQLAYYAAAAILITFSALAAGKPPSLALVFGWQIIRGDVVEGWMFALCWMLVALVMVIALLLLIARSKLIPDFALTIHALHLIAVTLYDRSLPRNLFWWTLQATSAALMTGLGIWSCRWRELQPINFGGHGGGSGAAAAVGDVAGDGQGFPAGRGKGRGADGAGVYEMVGKG